MGRTGRPRAGQERLTRERIVAAAVQLIDEHGMEALSMRRLASILGVDPMAIYNHLAGKEAVLAAVAEAVFTSVRLPPAAGRSWQERVMAIAHAYRTVVRAHPNLVQHLIANATVAAPVALAINEALYAAFDDAGLPPSMVVRAADLVVDYTNGFTLGERGGPLGESDDRAEVLAVLGSQPAEEFPVTRRVLGAVPATERSADFDVGLSIILAGVTVLGERSHTTNHR